MGSGPHPKLLVAAFAAVASVFMASSAVTYRTIARIDDEMADLKRNSLPSVAALSAARSDVQRARLLADELTLSPEGWDARSFEQLRSHQASLRTRLAQYEQTAWYAGERELYETRLLPALERLDQAAARLEQDGRGGGRRPARADLDFDRAASDADEALTEDLDLNHAYSLSATETVMKARRDYDRLAMLLTLASALVAAAAAWAALQLLRGHERLAQQKLEHEAARSAELEMFAARVGHDMLGPLTTVALTLGGIARHHADPATRAAVARAERTLERSRTMVRGIYEFSRSGGRPAAEQRAPLRQGILSAVDDLAAPGPDAATEVNVEPFEELEVGCCPGVLGVILSNLLGNAAKCMRESPVRRVTVRALRVDGRARVEVEDTGPGAPPEMEAAIFEPYVRGPAAAPGGLGLGLATVKRLVEGHGGAVGVRGAPQGGALFFFELPLAPPKAESLAGAPGVRAPVPST